MSAPRKFWILLGLVTAFACISLILIDYLLPISEALSAFMLWSVAVFFIINVIAYYLGIKAVRSKSNYRFVHLMMMLILFKMIICVLLVVGHVKINQPASKAFVLPFLAIYLIFTLFEIYVLEKIARTKPLQSGS